MDKEKIGNQYYQLTQVAKQFKYLLNEDKLALGTMLYKLQDLHMHLEQEGVEDFGTFKTALAELHLNARRSMKLMQNARYAKEYEIPEDDYKYFDSAVLELIRVNKKDPIQYLNDIQAGLSFTDLEKIISSS